MRFLFLLLFFQLVCLPGFNKALAQTVVSLNFAKQEKVDKKTLSNSTYRKSSNKKLDYIIKKSARGTLYGNKCVSQYTRRLGFEYLLVTNNGCVGGNYMEQKFHNFKVNLGITLRRGPFWKLRLKKNISDCQQQSGDFIG